MKRITTEKNSDSGSDNEEVINRQHGASEHLPEAVDDLKQAVKQKSPIPRNIAESSLPIPRDTELMSEEGDEVRSSRENLNQNVYAQEEDQAEKRPEPEEEASVFPPYSPESDGKGGFQRLSSMDGNLNENEDCLHKSNSDLNSNINMVMDSILLLKQSDVDHDAKIDGLKSVLTKQAVRQNNRHRHSSGKIEMNSQNIQQIQDILKLYDNGINSKLGKRCPPKGTDHDGGVLSWKIPFDDLKEQGKQTLLTMFRTQTGHTIEAKLYLEGYGRGKGTHLSLSLRETADEGDNSAIDPVNFDIRLQVFNPENPAESVTKKEPNVPFHGTDSHETGYKCTDLIQLVQVERQNFVVNGMLLLIITMTESQC